MKNKLEIITLTTNTTTQISPKITSRIIIKLNNKIIGSVGHNFKIIFLTSISETNTFSNFNASNFQEVKDYLINNFEKNYSHLPFVQNKLLIKILKKQNYESITQKLTLNY